MKKSLKYTTATLMLVGALAASSQAQADYMIDAFGYGDTLDGGGNYYQDTTATSPGTVPNAAVNISSDSDLSGISRSSSTTAGGTGDVNVKLNFGGSGTLEIINDATATSSVQFSYTFTPLNFALTTTELTLASFGSSLGVNGDFTVSAVVNGTSTWSAHSFNQTSGDVIMLFSDFSDATVFNSVSSITLTYTGAAGVDTTFYQLTADTAPTPTPEPATIALMGLGLAGFAAARKKKQA